MTWWNPVPPADSSSFLARSVERVRRYRGIPSKKFGQSIRPSDIFLVTYPKSGTTWLAMMIANVLYPQADVNLRNYEEMVPDINNLYFTAGSSLDLYSHLKDPRVFLVHARYDPAFPRVIYVLRDPRDVMVSYFHFRRQQDPNLEISLEDFIVAEDHFPCTWDVHVREWLLEEGRGTNLLVVRYEDMHRDIERVLREVLDHLKIPHSPGLMRRAIESCRFDRLRSLERAWREEEIARGGQIGRPDEWFIRRGEVGGFRDELTPTALNTIMQKFGEVMSAVGYEQGI